MKVEKGNRGKVIVLWESTTDGNHITEVVFTKQEWKELTEYVIREFLEDKKKQYDTDIPNYTENTIGWEIENWLEELRKD